MFVQQKPAEYFGLRVSAGAILLPHSCNDPMIWDNYQNARALQCAYHLVRDLEGFGELRYCLETQLKCVDRVNNWSAHRDWILYFPRVVVLKDNRRFDLFHYVSSLAQTGTLEKFTTKVCVVVMALSFFHVVVVGNIEIHITKVRVMMALLFPCCRCCRSCCCGCCRKHRIIYNQSKCNDGAVVSM